MNIFGIPPSACFQSAAQRHLYFGNLGMAFVERSKHRPPAARATTPKDI